MLYVNRLSAPRQWTRVNIIIHIVPIITGCGTYNIGTVARAPPRFVTIRVGKRFLTRSLSLSLSPSLPFCITIPPPPITVYPLVAPRPRLFRQIKSQILLFHYIILYSPDRARVVIIHWLVFWKRRTRSSYNILHYIPKRINVCVCVCVLRLCIPLLQIIHTQKKVRTR